MHVRYSVPADGRNTKKKIETGRTTLEFSSILIGSSFEVETVLQFSKQSCYKLLYTELRVLSILVPS